MKKTLIAILLGIMLFPCHGANLSAQIPAATKWHDNKYSMFIHFGLYSIPGGVWEGQPVKRGYSEQIQMHAGIYGDEYSELAYEFNPVNFDADKIVELARRAGMRSIVITSKHHDGFCLFNTATTNYNSYTSSPCHRDIIKELSQACKRGGVNLGLYYSLIDWHHPGASNMLSTNANPIPPLHHELNMAQVTELVTNYGPISELWFDMGSLTPQQSRDLYQLVRKHQPDCMVSGRLGNGQYDFAVMSDNFYPDASLQTDWQSAASMFDETWGYRSWQVRGDAHTKAQEKLRSLLRVASGGGNFILNIGPDGTGAVVPWEAEVLEEIGSWIHANEDVLYSTEGSPYRAPFNWGCITRKGEKMNVILSGERPQSGIITLPAPARRLLSCSGPAKARIRKGQLEITLDPDAYQECIQVVRLVFDSPVTAEDAVLTNTKIANTSYFCQDYYSNERSRISYFWNANSSRGFKSTSLSYAASDIGKPVRIEIDGKGYDCILPASSPSTIMVSPVEESDRYFCVTRKSEFRASAEMDFTTGKTPDRQTFTPWTPTASSNQKMDGRPMQALYLMETITSPCDQDIIIEIGAGNGMELYVNGKSVCKHLNPYRCSFRTEKVRVSLHEGRNQIVLRSYNRNEYTLEAMLKVSQDQNIYSMPLDMPELTKGTSHRIAISRTDLDSPHMDCELHNLQLNIK